MAYIISYALHLLISVLFFLLIPLPFLIKGTMADEDGRLKVVLKVYHRIIWFAHGGLVVALITGIIMNPIWFSLWLLFVILTWVALSAFLGMTAKMTRLTLENLDKSADAKEEIAKLRKFSFLLSISIIVMFAVKFLRYV